MFDDVPVRVWLLIAILMAAWVPGATIYRHLSRDRHLRDITQRADDLSSEAKRRLAISIAVLVALAALAIFIFTPTAERLAKSPELQWLLPAALGLIALFSVVRALFTGKIAPMVRGVSRSYERAEHPKRFWASVAWNACFGALLLWLGVFIGPAQSSDRCHDYQDKLTPQEQIAACNEALAQPRDTGPALAGLYRARGYARQRADQPDAALADYDRALRLDPDDSYALYNRGLLHLAANRFDPAIADLSRSIALRPDNPAAYRNRAEAYGGRGAYDDAIADLGIVLRGDPADEWALAARAFAQAERAAFAAARQDLAQLRAAHPDSDLLPEMERALAFKLKDAPSGVSALQAMIDAAPDDQWAMVTLAGVLELRGRPDEAVALRRRVAAMQQAANR